MKDGKYVICYIHGFRGNPYDENYNLIAKRIEENPKLSDNIELITLDYNLKEDYSEVIDMRIRSYLWNENVDLIIATGIGAFWAMLTNLPKLLWCPCLSPKNSLPHIGYDGVIAKQFYRLEDILNEKLDKKRETIIAYFTFSDSVVGQQYKRQLEIVARNSKTATIQTFYIPGTHSLDEETSKEFINKGLNRLFEFEFHRSFA